jgi:hypothetical protein
MHQEKMTSLYLARREPVNRICKYESLPFKRPKVSLIFSFCIKSCVWVDCRAVVVHKSTKAELSWERARAVYAF